MAIGFYSPDYLETLARVNHLTIRGVYGEPYDKDHATVTPAARVSAKGGSGAARGCEHSGGGFRVDAEPVGAFVIRNGEVEWKPVFDLSSVVRRGQLIGFIVLLVLLALLGALRRR